MQITFLDNYFIPIFNYKITNNFEILEKNYMKYFIH